MIFFRNWQDHKLLVPFTQPMKYEVVSPARSYMGTIWIGDQLIYETFDDEYLKARDRTLDTIARINEAIAKTIASGRPGLIINDPEDPLGDRYGGV